MLTAARSHSSYWLHGIFILILLANFGFWTKSRFMEAKWGNVPPAPQEAHASFVGLGDEEVSYRFYGYFLQNLGNTGGQYLSLQDYDYDALEKWFFVAKDLDPEADYVPFMAAYLFGALPDGNHEKFSHLVTYLAAAGKEPYPEKWRWLAQAIYIAQYKEKNLDKALTLANELAALPVKKAVWAEQMPAFIKLKMGDKQASYEIMTHILATEWDKVHPNEVNYMKDFICTRTLSKDEAAKNPLCKDLK